MKEKILKKLGISALNEMQNTAYSRISEYENDILLLSPTGTGKTLAYLLPLIEDIDFDDVEVQMLVITPSRELALQSHDVTKNIGCGVRSMACYGGRPAMDEHRRMRDVNPHIVFATPGRLLDHLEKGNIETSSVEVVVIDEFDKCLEMGFLREMKAIMDFLGDDVRRIFLSATDIEEMPSFVNLHRMKRLDFLPKNEQVNDRVESYVVLSEEKDKLPVLSRLLADRGDEQTIVFLNYRDAVERTAEYLKEQGFYLKSFHGGLDQRQREQALHQFCNGSVNILVCTDLASRGLDIPSISNIVHYHLPLGKEEYIHRVGRTARWDAEGNTFFILNEEEHLPEFIETVPEEYVIPENANKVSMPKMVTLYIGKGKKDKISKGDIVGFLCKSGG
ncbi:MAG: DEAD/DEAH box helicase, partial [Prevotella sp.]|nr:DEAD/DEAH box helicase [Prevotella sp.]